MGYLAPSEIFENMLQFKRAKLGQIQGGLQRDSQDTKKGGCNNFLLSTR